MDRLDRIKEWHYDHGDAIEKWIEQLAEKEIHELHIKHPKEVDIIEGHCDFHEAVCRFIAIREKYDDKKPHDGAIKPHDGYTV